MAIILYRNNSMFETKLNKTLNVYTEYTFNSYNSDVKFIQINNN